MRHVLGLVVLLLVAACTPAQEATPPADVRAVPTRYVALGDSLATGAGAERGYAERFAEELEEEADEPVRFTNLARNGWTSADLLAAVRDDAGFADALDGAEIVTVNVGGNDLLAAQAQVLAGRCDGDACLRAAVESFAQNWDAILAALDGRVPEDAQIVALDVYNPFVAGLRALGVLERLQPFLDEVNEHIRASSKKRGLDVVSVHTAFNGGGGARDPVTDGLIASDRLHPSDEGHALIADLLVGESRRSSVPPRG